MAGFEHDYLDYNYLSMPYLRKTHNAAHTWLAGIDGAALRRGLPVQMCMALPSDLMASLSLPSVTNYRASTDYGIDDSSMPLQTHDANLNIGASSLLGFALGLRPSKDIFWTRRPANCRGDDPSADPKACGRWGAHTNPGSNCELNAIVATLSTGPLSIADKAGDTNATIVARCVRADGRILQPDKPATAVDSMFASGGAALAATGGPPSGAKRHAPPGQVWATSVALSGVVWHYVLSVDVKPPWRRRGDDLYPKLARSAEGWVAHAWFTGHAPTPCVARGG